MGVFAVSYDLSSPSRNYDNLYEALQSCGDWCHCLDSTWLVSSNLTAIDIANRLWRVLDSDDSLLVTPVASGSAWAGFTGECGAWLRANLL